MTRPSLYVVMISSYSIIAFNIFEIMIACVDYVSFIVMRRFFSIIMTIYFCFNTLVGHSMYSCLSICVIVCQPEIGKVIHAEDTDIPICHICYPLSLIWHNRGLKTI